MPDALALSVEEANRIRVAMGMAPLGAPAAPATGPSFRDAQNDDGSDEEPASTIDTRQAAAYDNWQKLQDEADAKKKREARLAAIKKEREKASRLAKLEGKGLADEGNDEDDMAWLKGTKKRQKKIAKAEQMQKELEERERQAQEALQYTEADLAGVKVGHKVDDFDDGEDQILVLKDAAIDEDDGDELEAVALKEKERLQEKLDSKKRKRAYDPNDVDEAGQGSILAQYDEEIEGKKRKAFTLDGLGKTVEQAQAEASGTAKPKKVAISLDILQDDTPANDYMDISEVKIKKPKKKKDKKSRRKHVEVEEDIFPTQGDEAEEEMEIDEPEEVKPKVKKNLYDTSFVDDDDLQANLAAQRKKALKKRKKMRPEDLARQLREEGSATPDIRETTEAGDDEPGLVIDETTEFVQNLERSKSEEAEEERRQKRRKSSHISNGIASAGGTQSVDPEGDIDMEQSYAEASDAQDREHTQDLEASTNITGTGLDEEETVDRGLGATLKLLKQRGVVKDSNSGDLNTQYRDRQKFLADKQRAETQAERLAKEQRERERNSGRWNNMTTREREEWARKNNTSRDQMESRRLAEIFNKEYKPNVSLSYVDEFGREMNQKEAFKQLSHQFHGKGSGNQKTQKHLDKIAAEKKKLAESSLETSLSGGMSNAQGQQSKKHKQAGVRLQ
jgi:U4/U6.U5 tri-snRNP-associated protein 1